MRGPFRWLAVCVPLTILLFALEALTTSLAVRTLTGLSAAACTACAATLALRVRRFVAGPAGRFWTTVGLAIALIGTNMALRALNALPGLLALEIASTVARLCGIALMVFAVIRLPFGQAGRADRAALRLDILTVMGGGAAFLWHILGSRVLTGHTEPDTLVIIAIGMITGLIGVFAVTKMVLGADGPVSRRALPLVGVAAVIGGLGSALGALLAGRFGADPLAFTTSLASTAIALGARRQVTDSHTVPVARPARRWSRLPYLAVAAVDALLIVVVATDHPDRLVVAVCAVLLTGLVIYRQVGAFRENDRLVIELGHRATHDGLTGLANRALFHTRVRDGGPGGFSVVLIDLDDFKTVNDTLGHAAGDTLLTTVASRMLAAVRPQDTVARLGGDEFALLLAGLDADAVNAVLTRIAAALREPVEVAGRMLGVRASFGVAAGRAGDDPGELLRRADVAMYQAKSRGEGGHQHYAEVG